MKTLACYLYFISILLMGSELYAHSLTVQDPQNRWKSSTGTIDSATLTIKPQGAYCEYSYYIYFSARNSGYENPTDTLEVQYQFSLPEGSFITDSWLWVEDTLVQAMLIDRAIAEQIYEGIVKRRRDPSILYKNTQTNYELRVFPLAGNKFRKVKITWLEPVLWNSKTVNLTLPIGMINISRIPLQSIRLLLYTDETWKNPKLGDNLITNNYNDEFFGPCKVIDHYKSDFNKYIITYDAPLQNGTYIQCVPNNPDEGYYQLVMLPKIALDFTIKKKVLFLVDFDPGKTEFDRTYILSNLKNTIQSTFTSQDSFNIFISYPKVQAFSDTWVHASSGNIDSIFNLLKIAHIAPYTNLPQLFFEAIDYLKNNGKDASIVLIGCSSDAMGSYQSANPVIESIRDAADFPVQINIIDYSKFRGNFTQNNRTYRGNEYFYNFLTQWSGGYYHDTFKEGYDFNLLLTNLISEIEGDIKSFELYTSLQDGFCYGRYNISNTILVNQMVAQVGKYYGKPPFEVKATGFHKSISFNKDLTIDVTPTSSQDRTLEKIWIGSYIKTLELASPKTNDVIREIVDVSMDYRVLSLYTAYLALEPWRMRDTINNENDPNEDEGDDDWNTEVKDYDISTNSGIKAYPNPFSSKININLSSLKAGTIVNSISVYNVIGNIVKSFSISDLTYISSELVWDGRDSNGINLPNGTYLVVINTNNGPITLKVILFR